MVRIDVSKLEQKHFNPTLINHSLLVRFFSSFRLTCLGFKVVIVYMCVCIMWKNTLVILIVLWSGTRTWLIGFEKLQIDQKIKKVFSPKKVFSSHWLRGLVVSSTRPLAKISFQLKKPLPVKKVCFQAADSHAYPWLREILDFRSCHVFLGSPEGEELKPSKQS
jgi:hypothetical protein